MGKWETALNETGPFDFGVQAYISQGRYATGAALEILHLFLCRSKQSMSHKLLPLLGIFLSASLAPLALAAATEPGGSHTAMSHPTGDGERAAGRTFSG